ncbi:hypothetical protein MZI84_24940, partial [Escherichia coli]|nr:hypothetical protein [Escherichia coli]
QVIKPACSCHIFSMVLVLMLLDKNSLTPARATNSGLESKKPTQSRFFYVLIQTSFQMNSQLKIHTYYLPLHLHIR